MSRRKSFNQGLKASKILEKAKAEKENERLAELAQQAQQDADVEMQGAAALENPVPKDDMEVDEPAQVARPKTHKKGNML